MNYLVELLKLLYFNVPLFSLDFFGGLIPVILYWLICAVVIFIALAYRTTHYKGWFCLGSVKVNNDYSH